MDGVGARLAALRKKRQLTQQSVANKVGVTKSVVSSYEREQRVPSCDVLIKLADIYYTTTDYILGRTTDKNPYLEGLSPEDIKIVTELVEHLRSQK